MTKIVPTDYDDGSTVTFAVVRRKRADVRTTFVFGQRTDQNHSGDAKNIGFGNKPRFDVPYMDLDADDSSDNIFVDTTNIIISPTFNASNSYNNNNNVNALHVDES